ncbi:MAG TPA: methyltransferase domain-containing protein [Labilithrix sp.]|jgi:hypothetical protein|nr:methyltransferase domain-containing protein [Labilithrix sp.]
MTRLPLWVRALQWTDRLAWYAYRTEEVTRDALLLTFLRPELRAELTAQLYDKQVAYLPGGATHQKGLFEWEESALSTHPFPKQGRILLGAAGGGRELRVLCERGFEVVAFEPNDTLRAGAEKVARHHPKAQVVAASYEDLVRAANEKTGLLADALGAGHFDAVILGWGSLTHVLSRAEQLALLKAVRRSAPKGAVLISFFLRPATSAKGKSDRLRDTLSWLFSAMGKTQPAEGLAYEMNNGFVYSFTEDEIFELAMDAGYEVFRLQAWPFPHAVLVPLATAAEA